MVIRSSFFTNMSSEDATPRPATPGPGREQNGDFAKFVDRYSIYSVFKQLG